MRFLRASFEGKGDFRQGLLADNPQVARVSTAPHRQIIEDPIYSLDSVPLAEAGKHLLPSSPT